VPSDARAFAGGHLHAAATLALVIGLTGGSRFRTHERPGPDPADPADRGKTSAIAEGLASVCLQQGDPDVTVAHRLKSSPWERFNELLARVTGDEDRASELIFLALGASEREKPPESIDEVLEFAAANVTPLLEVDVGHAMATQLVSRIHAELVPPRHHSDVKHRAILPPQSELATNLLEPPISRPVRKKQPSISGEENRPVVFLLYTNALHRAEVARAFVRDGFEVRLIGSPSDLAHAAEERTAPSTTAVVDVEHGDAEATLRTLAGSHPDALIVICAPTAIDALDAAEHHGIGRFEIYVKAAPLRELEARVRRDAI
jgi:hypothetical protein